MTLHLSLADEEEALKIAQDLKNTTINDKSFLSTDYLNHYNEVVMLLEMLCDMPEFWEEIKSWDPKGYQEFFREGSFSFKELAVKAYSHAPLNYRVLFDETAKQIDDIILSECQKLKPYLEDPQKIAQYQEGEIECVLPLDILEETQEMTKNLRSYMDKLSSIINGTTMLADNLADTSSAGEVETIQQSVIDDMF